MSAYAAHPAPQTQDMSSSARWSHGLDIANTAFASVLLFCLMAISHYVLREPAPYDLLMVATAGMLFMLGLRIPAGVALPFGLMVLVLCGYMIGGTGARYIDMSIKFLQTSTYLTLTFVFYTAVVTASPDRALKALWGGYIFAGLCAAALGIGGYLGFIPGADILLGSGRAKGLFEDPNVYGPFLVPPTIYAIWRMTTRGVTPAVFFWGPIATVLVLGLFLSFSRGAWLHMMLSAAAFAVLASMAPETRGQRGRIVMITILLGVMLTLAIGWAITIPEVRELLEQRLGLQSYDTKQGGRFSGQFEALKMAMINPFGIGANNWGMLAAQDTHNVYLNVFVSGGFISLVGLVGAFGLTLVRGFKYAMHGPRRGVFIVAFASFIGLIAEAIIIDINHWRHLYVLMGMIWGLMLAAPPATHARR
ncbi:O-antigen ligase family protein [Pyruvatibacter sp. HU-CL02332]|uniref:O-antigen ligase family protein n=1 Tax=Pyruvatibacter sp. HU-CL02332 TaxID=3127650 RepID=UPI00310A1A53